VKVVALVDRGHRELPIKIDHVGKNIPTQPGETVQLEVEGDVDDPASTTLEVIVLPGASAEAGDSADARSGRGA
jgi:pyrimidine operon attenuation protein/uracil phosphoribosyltransferase